MVARKKQFEPKVRPTYSNAEIESYRQAIDALPQYRFDGILISPMYRYMITKGVLKLENGEFIVVDPREYKRINDLDARMPKERFKPAQEFWDDIRAKIGLIKERVIHAYEV